MFERSAYLLSPYRPPTSYPVSLPAGEVSAWLNGFAALWHPAVVAACDRPAVAASVYDHDMPVRLGVYARPDGPALYQADDWLTRLADVDAVTFTATADRAETYANLQAVLVEKNRWRDADPEAVRAFAGVGFGLLMLDTLFDAMNHDKLLDAAGFWADVSAAARADGDWRPHLVEAAKKLQVAREGLYSGTIHLLEWIARTADTLALPWPAAVHGNTPVSLIVSGELLDRMAAEQPERFAELSARIPADRPVSVEPLVGGYADRDDAVLPVESQVWNLAAGVAAVKRLFGVEPAVYGRLRSAFHPQLPSWLSACNLRHGLAVSFDGAVLPSRYSTIVGTPGPDGKSVDFFTRTPQPADDPATFFNFAYHIHQAISTDSNPTLALLHKRLPATGYDDFAALHALAPVFGQANTLTGYFREVYSGDYAGVVSADEYFTDYLDDRVTNRHRTDAVSGFALHARLRRRLDTAFTLAGLYRSLSPVSPDDEAHLAGLLGLEQLIEARGPDVADVGPPVGSDPLSQKLEPLETAVAEQLARRVQVRSANRPGFLVFNPCGFARRVAVELPNQAGAVPLVDPVKASEFDAGTARVVLDVPALGYAWLPRGEAGTVGQVKIKTADGTTVRNEFFEAEIDPLTGGLKALRDSKTRLNRLGQLLAFNPGSKMVASGVTVTKAGAALGEVVSTGTVVDEHGRPLAEFRQRFRAWVGRPVLELRIELTPSHPPTGYPWHAYYAARFGWRDDRSALFRGVNGANSQTTHTRPMSADYAELRLGRERTFIFLGGLPFVQKQGPRLLDVILQPEGETATVFELLLAADRDYPMQTAQGWVTPTPVVATQQGPPPSGPSGWLGSIDLPSLLLTHLRPVPGERAVTARLLETAGFAGAAELRFARDVAGGALLDLTGQVLQDLPATGGGLAVECSAGELLTVKAVWG